MKKKDIPIPFVLDDSHLKGVPKNEQAQAEKDYMIKLQKEKL
jgi:hypothetical protein